MGNIKGRARRNKKPNNWKATRKSKKEAMKKNLYNSELGERDALCNISENPTINFEEYDKAAENVNNSMKRRRISDCEEYIQVESNRESEFYSAWLSEGNDDDDNEDNNGKISIEYETQEVDPLLTPQSDDYIRYGNNDETIDGDDEDEEVLRQDFYNLEDLPEEDNNDALREDDNDDEEYETEGHSIDDGEDNNDRIGEEKLIGRRIFDVSELFRKIKRIGKHSRNCSFEDMMLLGEIKKGLNSIFKFQCKKCGCLRTLHSNPKKPNSLSANEEAVLGITSIGSGFYHLQEFMSQLNVPCMGSSTYDNISNDQQSTWYDLAKKLAQEALQKEIDLAIAAGHVDSNGNALLSVICDGGWGKRSYGKKFNSLSGCAVLVGVRTKKVIYFGVKNKYCHTCKIAQSKFAPVKEHTCNINYQGPSSGMEAQIIVDGFKECEQLGARFNKLIADGDSSTYKILRDFRIYKNPDLIIEKIECINHLCRNFRSKFAVLEKATKFDIKLRKHVKPSKGNDICKGVKCAAKHWRESQVSLSEKISNLEKDVMNAPSHYFGVHTHCKSYFCSKTTARAAIDNLDLLKSNGLYYEVLNLCQVYFAGNVMSLLENQTNNAAEEFNNLVAKYLGGKRINYSLARSYTARVAIAVVQYNSEGRAASSFQKFKFGDDFLHQSSIKLEDSRRRKLNANAAAVQIKPRDRHPKESFASGYHHGIGTEDVDMTPDQLEKCKKIFLEKLKRRQNNRNIIERQTIDKKFSSYWHMIRQDLLPANHFYKIINAAKRDSYTNILQELMYNRSEFGNNAQIKHQRLVERDALDVFQNLFPYEPLTDCGIFIDKKLPFICATPFKLYGEDHILNIKCPVKEYNKKFEKAIPKIKFFKKKGTDVTINEKSDWFIELQGQMRVTDRKNAFIMIWLGESNYRVIEVERNDKFFNEKMEDKLTYFYNEVMLKELVDSRVSRHMKLRKYDSEKLSFV